LTLQKCYDTSNCMTCKLFNLTIPIIQAPMAGIATPELVAAVSNAGALGSLGAGYMQPDQIRSSIKKIKSLTNKPFSVNLFIPEESPPSQDTSHMKEFLTHIWKEISDAPFEVPNVSLPSFDEQVNVLLEEKIPVFSFTFGVPPISTIERFKSQGTIVYCMSRTRSWGTSR
jgi:nitronate monooxygenase